MNSFDMCDSKNELEHFRIVPADESDPAFEEVFPPFENVNLI